MTLTVTLPPEMERKLLERAAQTGREVTVVAQELIERGLTASPSIDEILAPFRREVAASGITDEELDALFQEAREEAWQEQQGARE
jgi:hypothetical protein